MKEPIAFVGKISKSGRKRLINIPAELFDKIDDSYYKIYMIKVEFQDILEKEGAYDKN